MGDEFMLVGVSRACRDVAKERERQIKSEGWTPEHDDLHGSGELAGAAACYAMQAVLDHIGKGRGLHDTVSRTIRELWPFSNEWWKPKNNRHDLVRAAALIIAEIERIDRAETKHGDKP